MGILGVLDTVAHVIPGYKTVKETAKGFFEDGLSGAAKGLLRGFSQDWALGIAAAIAVPGAGAMVGLAQLGLWGTNELTGALDSKHERAAQSQSQGQQQQLQSPGYW